MTSAQRILIARAFLKYEFRPPRADEDEASYTAALIAHVERRDYAAAHEIRVGKPQAEWTSDDVKHFQEHILARGQTRDEFGPGLHTFATVRDAGPYPTTDAQLLALAARGLDLLASRRRQKPTAGLPIFASVLLTTGVMLTASVGSDDRIAVIKVLAKTQPVYGFFVVFDGWIHHIEIDTKTGRQTATKTDCLIAQVGTRSLRVMKRRPYKIYDGGAAFIDPPPPDTDVREERGEDPYAGIFVTVPEPTGRPS